MAKSDYFLRNGDVARLIAHPRDDIYELSKRVRNYVARGLIPVRYTDESDGRKPVLHSPADAVMAAILKRVMDTGLNDAESSQAVSVRLHAWRPQDMNPDWKSPEPFPDMTGAPDNPAAYIWEGWQANPSAAQWSLSIRWLRSNVSGQRWPMALLHNAAEGLLGSDLPPDGVPENWEIEAEMVIVLDNILAQITSRLAAMKAH